MVTCNICRGVGLMPVNLKSLDTCTRCGGAGKLFGAENVPEDLTSGDIRVMLFPNDREKNPRPEGYNTGPS